MAILEKLEVKSCASNQEAFQRTDGFMYLLSEEKRRRGELKEEPSGSPDGSKEKYDKASLLTWYNSYMFSKFDLSTPAKAQVRSHASHRWPLSFDDLTHAHAHAHAHAPAPPHTHTVGRYVTQGALCHAPWACNQGCH